MRRPRFLRDYTPPTFAEFEATAGPELAPLHNFRLYDLMCQAMRHKVYDRAEAFERLRSSRERNEWFAAMSRSFTPTDRGSV